MKQLYTRLIKRLDPSRYVYGIDLSNGTDYGCKCEGYRTKDDKVIITKVTYTR